LTVTVDDARRRLDEAARTGSLEAIARATCDLGVALSDAGDTQGARAAWEWVVNSGDLDQAPRALRNLAMGVRQSGDRNGSRELLQRAIAMNHPVWSREAALDLAYMDERDGDGVSAAAALAPLAQSANAEPIALVQFVRGRWFELQGDTAAALTAFGDVLSQPNNHRTSLAARHLAAIYQRTGNSSAAEWALRHAIQVSMAAHDGHEEGHAHASLGELLLKRQEVEAARVEFGRAAEVGPAEIRSRAHYRLGRLDLAEADNMPAPRRRRRLAEQAITHFQQALADADGDPAVNVRLSLGYGYELIEDVPAARSVYEGANAVASPEQRGSVLLSFAEFLVRQKMWAEAGPLLDSLVDGATSDIAERARKLRDKRPG